MKLIKNTKACLKFSTIILIAASLIAGALLSYLWVMGYYVTMGIKVPEKTALTIDNVVFTPQNTSYFNITFFNPSYSPDANITGIAVVAEAEVYSTPVIYPSQRPYIIQRAENKTFQCKWNWAKYSGQTIGISSFVDEGSGPTYVADIPRVNLTITDVHFNASITEGVARFNFTVQNSQNSATYVNMSAIAVPTGNLSLTKITPSLPRGINVGGSETFKCIWDWTEYHNKSITITVHTMQGYSASYNVTKTPLLGVEITDVDFSESDTTHFNMTVRNRKESSTFVNITRINVKDDGTGQAVNGTVIKINGTQVTPEPLPYKLNINSNVTLKCEWNWTLYWGRNITVSISTAQNYTVSYTRATPSPIKITNAIFNVADTNSFNVTVHNSPYYYTNVSITNIALTLEDGTVKEINGTKISPSLLPKPYTLNQSSSISFKCPWNWTGYQNRKVTITVKTAKNYTAQLVKTTPAILAITSISFDPINASIFSVTVRNSAPLENVTITKVTVTLENETIRQASILTPSSHLINSNSTETFTCQWNWTDYRGKTITIKVYAVKEYVASSLYTTPPLQ